MDILYRGFDGLDVAFQGALPRELVARLEAAKEQAQAEARSVLIEHNGVRFTVAETGAQNGYAFRCDTGRDGAVWFFKRGMNRADWNIRVSVASMALALYGLGGVRAQLYRFLAALDTATSKGGESIGRVDFAVDVLMSEFELVPDNFVMHSHTNRRDQLAAEEMAIGGKPGRVTSVTVGQMPRRQVIVYDKRSEVIAKHKVHWWEIWNAARRARGLVELDPKDRIGSRVWRVELRAGKERLKERWAISKWADLDAKLGDLFQATLRAVRYTEPTTDSNRARWPNHALWDAVILEVTKDLFEMTSGAEPARVKQVYREHLQAVLRKQIIGNAVTLAAACAMEGDDLESLPDSVAVAVERYQREKPEHFAEKLQGAKERYYFLDTER